jgi:aspartyl/asparaginyl beta-hydroxylase (cupin superfamily)
VIYEPRQFDFSALLEQHWREIHDEYLRIIGDLMDWPERKLYGEGWKVFGLFDFPHGEPIEANVCRCSFTASLIQNHIKEHGAAGFSVLLPGTRIQIHQGYPGPFLRCHLGLEVPEGDCALRVGGETRKWQTGTVLVFDDRVPHEAWNLTGAERVALLIDFVPEKQRGRD